MDQFDKEEYNEEAYTTPHRERKNNRFKHLTQAYLPGLMLAVALVGVILIIVGAIRGNKSKDGNKDLNIRRPNPPFPQRPRPSGRKSTVS